MQGFNMGKYVPPDLEGTVSGNALSGKHALGSRARKLASQGILTVRFEMPFAVWCSHCPKPTIIGQGVRFNAEKKKVGNYHSTPVYSFRMKHAACGGVIEIRTDPRNTAYVVVEGGRKRDHGEDKVREGEVGMEILTAEERERRRQDAFTVLEGKKDDAATEKVNKFRIEELHASRERDWEDPYETSRRLRKGFRVERKAREKSAKITEALRERMGLDIELLPESEGDAERAGFVEFGLLEEDGAVKAASKPLFAIEDVLEHGKQKQTVSGKKASTKAEKELERRRKALQQQIHSNTRAAQDPFLSGFTTKQPDRSTAHAISGIKRKRPVEISEGIPMDEMEAATVAGDLVATPSQQPTSLVAYDSD